LFGESTSAGRLSSAITAAVVNVLPEPVMPSSVWWCAPERTPATRPAIAAG
jgi:hypothetical protein